MYDTKEPVMLRTIRIISQCVFFLVFVILLFFLNNQNFAHRLQTEIFLQLNPLVALLSSIASRKVIWALLPGAVVVTVVTMLLGRVFCGWICPLGAAIDFSDHFIIGKARNISRRPRIYIQRLKYVLLLFLAVLSMFGVLVPFFMDPISIATRISAIIIDPSLQSIKALSGNVVNDFSNLFSVEKKTGQILSIVIPGSFASLFIFIAVFIGGFWDRRFWCQYVCPTGAFLGLLSRFPLLRRFVHDDKCNSCHACATRQCPVRAINHDSIKLTSSAECIVCGVCSNNRRECTSFAFGKTKAAPVQPPLLARRHFITGVLAGVLAPSVLRGTGADNVLQVQPIRPPGSLPEEEFLTRCIACGQCMKACPNHALHPCGFIDGLTKVNTPRLVPSIGYCEPGCTACTHVCPTVAIRPVQAQDKPYIKIGTAVVNRNDCIAWRGEMKCLVCKTHCPYQAIEVQDIECGELTQSGPVIDKELCTGCGICEKYCAVSSNPAIKVHVYGEHRISDGPFITDKKRNRISQKRKSNQESQ